MQLKRIELFTLYTLFQWIQGSNASFDEYTFPGDKDPEKYNKFYDPTEECKSTSQPCILSFKYCSTNDEFYGGLFNTTCASGAKKQEDLSWGGNNVNTWLDYEGSPVAVFPMYDSKYTLKWTNTNSKYPTMVTWQTIDLESENYYMYKEIDAGKDSWEFSFLDFATEMQPGSLIPSNSSSELDRNTTKYITDFALVSPEMYFTVGQPKDPKFSPEDGLYGYNENGTDKTTVFRLNTLDADVIGYTQSGARSYFKVEKDDIHKKWAKGVGIGVGVGVPLLMVIVFFVGMKFGSKRANKKNFKKQEVLSDDTELPEYRR